MRVLFLTHRLPYAPNRGDRVRAFHIVRTVAPQVDLELVSLAHDANELAKVERVREMGVRATAVEVPWLRNYARALLQLQGPRPLTHLLLYAPDLRPLIDEIVPQRPPDVVLAYCSGMARFALEPPLDRFPLVSDFVDVDSQKWATLSRTSSFWPKRWIYHREDRLLAGFEAHAAAQASSVLVVNDREADLLRLLAPGADIKIVPNGVDVPALPLGARRNASPSVVFCGVMNYTPNVESVVWFARHVWPRVRSERTDARFVVVGSDPTGQIRRLASPDSGIEVTGTVPEVVSHLSRCAVSVAPLKTARGVQTKVLEAIALGLPAVITSPVAEGLPSVVLPACRVADAPDYFARNTLSLLALTEDERRALAAQADLHTLTWERQLQPLPQILSAAAGVTPSSVVPDPG